MVSRASKKNPKRKGISNLMAIIEGEEEQPPCLILL